MTYRDVNICNGCEITNLDHHILPRSTRYGIVAGRQRIISNSDEKSTEFQNIIGKNIGEVISTYSSTSPSTGGGSTNTNETTYFYHEHLSDLTVQNQVYNDVLVIKSESILYPSQGPSHLQAEYFFITLNMWGL